MNLKIQLSRSHAITKTAESSGLSKPYAKLPESLECVQASTCSYNTVNVAPAISRDNFCHAVVATSVVNKSLSTRSCFGPGTLNWPALQPLIPRTHGRAELNGRDKSSVLARMGCGSKTRPEYVHKLPDYEPAIAELEWH